MNKNEKFYKEAFETYWNEIVKRTDINTLNELISMGMKRSLENAYKSGFFTALSLVEKWSEQCE